MKHVDYNATIAGRAIKCCRNCGLIKPARGGWKSDCHGPVKVKLR